MSREAAIDYILPRIQPHWNVLDIGAGELPFAKDMLARGCRITAVDRDVTRLEWGWLHAGKPRTLETIVGDIRHISLPPGSYDCVLASYSLQHMIGYELAVWVKIRALLKDRGRFIVTARYRTDSPRYEGQRGDPLMSQDERTIEILARYTLFKVIDLQRYAYEGKTFQPVEAGHFANAIGFQLEAVTP